MATLIPRISSMRVMEPRKPHSLHVFCTRAERRCALAHLFPRSPPGHALGSRTQRILGGCHACL